MSVPPPPPRRRADCCAAADVAYRNSTDGGAFDRVVVCAGTERKGGGSGEDGGGNAMGHGLSPKHRVDARATGEPAAVFLVLPRARDGQSGFFATATMAARSRRSLIIHPACISETTVPGS